MRMTVKNPVNPKLAKTEFRKLSEIDGKYTLLEVNLLTGRTHQIRVHLASIGFPIVGDETYGNAKVNRTVQESHSLTRQWLHAFRLEFILFDVRYSFTGSVKNDLLALLPEHDISPYLH